MNDSLRIGRIASIDIDANWTWLLGFPDVADVMRRAQSRCPADLVRS